jgi:hypothetical protein
MYDDGIHPQEVRFTSTHTASYIERLALDVDASDVAVMASRRLRDRLEQAGLKVQGTARWERADVRLRVLLPMPGSGVAVGVERDPVDWGV